MTSPCRGCGDRDIGCHGNCPKYKAYTAENWKQKRRRYLELLPDYYAGCQASKYNAQKSIVNKRMRYI